MNLALPLEFRSLPVDVLDPQQEFAPGLARKALRDECGEGVADAQLERFRSDPAQRGKTCRSGWWRYSRHPNYFFEWIIWLAFVPMAWGSPRFAASLAGPALMFLFLTRVSGVPPAEAQALRSRGDDYRDYQRTTSAFFPWFPRS